MIGDLNVDGAASVAEELHGKGLEVDSQPVDVSQRASIEELIPTRSPDRQLDVMSTTPVQQARPIEITEEVWQRSWR